MAAEIKFDEQFLDADRVVLSWDERKRRYMGAHTVDDKPVAVGDGRRVRRRVQATRPPITPVESPSVTLASDGDPSVVSLPDGFDEILRNDPAHQTARRRYREVWNDVYGLQKTERHQGRVLELVDVNNQVALATAQVAFRLGLASARGGRSEQ
jgi:hypothetical protein